MKKIEKIKSEERLKKRLEFERVFKQGRKKGTRKYNIYWAKNKRVSSRFAVITSKGLGKAVLRNRIKRIIREIYRRNKEVFCGEIDWIIIPKGNWETIDYRKEEKFIIDVVGKIKKGIKKEENKKQEKDCFI